jgi:hypothetical protein
LDIREENNMSWRKLHHMELQCVMKNYDAIKYARKGWRGGMRGIRKEV